MYVLFKIVWICLDLCTFFMQMSGILLIALFDIIASQQRRRTKCLCRQPDFFLLRCQFWPQLLTWNFHVIPGNFVQIPGTVLVATVFSYRLAYLSIVLISRRYPNYSLSPPTLTPRCLPSPNFSCFYYYNVVITFELEQFVECLLFCYIAFLFCFVCCARFVACVFVQLLYDLQQHIVKQFLSELKHSTGQLTICCLKFATWSTMQFTFFSRLMRNFCTYFQQYF